MKPAFFIRRHSSFNWLTSILVLSVMVLTMYLFIPVSAFAGKRIDWVSINPNLKDVPSVAVEGIQDHAECLLCHKKHIEAFGRTKHAQVLAATTGNNLAETCEVCHGPMSQHLREITFDELKQNLKRKKKFRPKYVVSFKALPAEKKNRVCLSCHENESLPNWRGSAHEMMAIGCDKCHHVMSKRGQRNLLAHKDSKRVCFQCHQDKRAAMMRTSHMPQRTGKLSCAKCHNPHGGKGPSLLKRATVNETCFQCHQEKRGPYIWEHPPVQENCANCHEPHGSNHRPLLKQKPPFLCQQCHMDVFHPSNIRDFANLRSGSSYVAGKACVNCHSIIHGSNHPSGARFQR